MRQHRIPPNFSSDLLKLLSGDEELSAGDSAQNLGNRSAIPGPSHRGIRQLSYPLDTGDENETDRTLTNGESNPLPSSPSTDELNATLMWSSDLRFSWPGGGHRQLRRCFSTNNLCQLEIQQLLDQEVCGEGPEEDDQVLAGLGLSSLLSDPAWIRDWGQPLSTSTPLGRSRPTSPNPEKPLPEVGRGCEEPSVLSTIDDPGEASSAESKDQPDELQRLLLPTLPKDRQWDQEAVSSSKAVLGSLGCCAPIATFFQKLRLSCSNFSLKNTGGPRPHHCVLAEI